FDQTKKLKLVAQGGTAGKITYAIKDAGTTGATLSGQNLTVNAAGNLTVIATRQGDEKYNDVSVEQVISVIADKAIPELEIDEISDYPWNEKCTLNVSGKGNGKVTFKVKSGSAGKVNATTGEVTFKTPGTIVVTATKAATSDYGTASKDITITTVKANQAPLIFTSGNFLDFNQTKKLKLVAQGGTTGRFIYAISNASTTGATLSGQDVTVRSVGEIAVIAIRVGNAKYNDVFVRQVITVGAEDF
ncbi:hypothetical protein, partial [Pseudolactococcus hodotermopsidis]|uniref:hypothetical protein n=1 Tax=Pseudolactococcus hodotermopsidis TaxID=2709157 RepID=UPI00155647F0